MTDTTPSAVPTRAELLERVTRLAGPAADHDEAARVSRAARDKAILDADDAGIPQADIARAAGVTRMQVYRVVLDGHVRRRAEQPVAVEPDVA